MVEKLMRATILLLCLTLVQCGGGDGGDDGGDPAATPAPTPQSGLGDSVRVLLLHHSTGQNVWDGGVPGWLGAYNGAHGKAYQIEERAYPDDPWPWDNYPSDYYRIWVQHQGQSTRPGTEWLETLAPQYNVILFKHCFPGGDIEPDSGAPDPASGDKTLENYRAAYDGLKAKLRSFPNMRFIVWTLAIRTQADMQASYGAEHAGMAQRAREFTEWTKNSWDERGDNIFVWDFYALETEGSLYLRSSYAADPGGDSHPNGPFCAAVAPLLGQRIVDVIEGRGDSGSLTGR
jgi:hypothetical protein